MPFTSNSGDGFQGIGLCRVRVNQIRAEITSATPANVTAAPAIMRGQNAPGKAKGQIHRPTATPAPMRAIKTRGGGKWTLAPPYLPCISLIRIGPFRRVCLIERHGLVPRLRHWGGASYRNID